MHLPSMRLDGQTALVTGAGGALGRAAALAFGAAGATVHLTDCNDTALAGTRDALHSAGYAGDAHVLDVTDSAAVEALVAKIDADSGLDLLLNNAGVISSQGLFEANDAEWQRVFQVNVLGTVAPSRAAARAMIARGRGGCILNLSSALARMALRNRIAYGATKAAVRNLTQNLALELGPHGIRANAIAPTAVVTDLNRELMHTQAELYRPLIEGTPLGRLCEATDLVGLMVLLASPAGSFISGQTLFVDGGFTVC